MPRTVSGHLRRHHLAIALIFVALAGTAVAAGERRGVTDDVIDACVKKKSKALSLAKNGRCPKRSTPISWNQVGPQGPAGTSGADGSDGADGAPGAAGSAVAYGRVNADGSLSHAAGASGVSTPSTGVYCIDIPAADPSSRSMIVSVEYNGSGIQNGTAHWTATDNVGDDPMSGGGRFAWAQWDAIPNFCAAGTYEVRTNRYSVDALNNDINVEPAIASFSFAVP